MIIVKYVDRKFIDRFRCVDTERAIKALSMFAQGGLTYFKINNFEYKVIENDFIKSIKDARQR